MGFTTKAFSLFYKRLGLTGSANVGIFPAMVSGSLPEFWFTASAIISVTGTPPNTAVEVSGAFLNFPNDINTAANYVYATTRFTTDPLASGPPAGGNQGYRALPWGSHAGDFLWNATVPSWSFDDSEIVTYSGDDYTIRNWSVSLTASESFNKKWRAGFESYGMTKYPVTSSWHIIDSKINTSQALQFYYIHRINGANIGYPTYVGSYPADPAYRQGDVSNLVAYDINFPTGSNSDFDNQYFDAGQGVGITRASIQASLTTASISSSNNTVTGLRHLTEALKARRLFFPLTTSGSGTSQGSDYWFKSFTGYNITDIFTENGGIYNIQFTLKRSIAKNYYPDVGSFMTVFIHDVNATVPNTLSRIPGASGWYPPGNNIVTIGNGYDTTPVMTFNEPSTGYLIEKFNFNVIQYGYPAQLCIEVSGSLNNNTYFGAILSDIEVCKIGVTTDPDYIKPTTTSTLSQGGYAPVPYIPPGTA